MAEIVAEFFEFYEFNHSLSRGISSTLTKRDKRACKLLLHYNIICYTRLYYTIIYHTIPYYTIVYYTIL